MAYEDLVRKYQDLAFRTAFLVTREASAAEDATQEAFLRAYRALSRFQLGQPFRPWMLKIVANEARRRKSNLNRQTLLEMELAASAWQPQTTVSLESTVLSAETRATVNRAVKQLSEPDQLVIAYRFAMDLSEAEIADAMDCPRGTVKSRLSRALARLREVLAAPEMEFAELRNPQ